MFKIKIISVGKTKEAWLEEAIQEYLKRLSPIASLEFIWVKDNQQLLQKTLNESNSICLDPDGKPLNSEQFSSLVVESLEKGGSRLTFVIGGPEGLPQEIKEKEILISLSRLTFTHQLTRLILVEQLYRAFEISKGSKYHK